MRLTDRSHEGSERGAALVFVLILGAIVFSLAVLGSRQAQIELQVAYNDVATKKALGAAEAGLTHGTLLMNADLDDGLDDELTGGGTGGGLAPLGSVITFDGQSHRFRAYGGGGAEDGYYVRVEDNWDETTGANDPANDVDGRVHLVSVGRVGTTERRLVTLVEADFGPECAIVTQGNLHISGNPTVTGIKSCAHTNRDLHEISGNPILQRGATATGNMEISGNPVMAGVPLTTGSQKNQYETDHRHQPVIPVPQMRPLNWDGTGLNLADAVNAAGGYLLSNNCRVYRGGTWNCSEATNTCSPSGATQVWNASSNPWQGWSCSTDSSVVPNRKWVLGSDTTVDGAFFVMGWANVGSSPGTPSVPWRATIIAMNTIDVSGNPDMVPFTTSGTIRNLLLVSGNDVGVSGNLGQTGAPGGIFAHQQIKFNGNPSLHGFIMAEDGATTWTGNPAPSNQTKEDKIGHNELPGNMTLVYNGLNVSLIPPTLERLSWKEVRTD